MGNRRRQRLRLSIGFCAHCGEPREGRARLCTSCARAECARQNGRRAGRDIRGLCTRCGGPRDEANRKRCGECRRAVADYQRSYAARRTSAGRCVRCGAPSGGYRQCRTHRIVAAAAMQGYRSAA